MIDKFQPVPSAEFTLDDILRYAEMKKASDIQISAGTQPLIKINGKFVKTTFPALSPQATKNIISSRLTDLQRERLTQNKELDLSFGEADVGRYRANVYYQRESLSISLRRIKTEIPTLEELHFPTAVRNAFKKSSGLIVIAGPAGSGKSTTMASILQDYSYQPRHIVTLEDPVEYLIPHNNSCIDQRELGTDVLSFEQGMRSVVRENPDVIAIGELRDAPSTEIAMGLADSGHLVITTIHAWPAVETISRICSLLQTKEWLRKLFAMNFICILSQRLITGSDGLLVPAVELILRTPAISAVIANGQLEQLQMYMNPAQGTITLKESLKGLENEGLIRSADSFVNIL